jgi:hypothetical protein
VPRPYTRAAATPAAPADSSESDDEDDESDGGSNTYAALLGLARARPVPPLRLYACLALSSFESV